MVSKKDETLFVSNLPDLKLLSKESIVSDLVLKHVP